jgi:hypothetical protein
MNQLNHLQNEKEASALKLKDHYEKAVKIIF